MISKRVSLSRDFFAAGVATIPGGLCVGVLFTPLGEVTGAPTQPPVNAPGGSVPVIWADRVFVSNPSTHPIIIRPVIPGSTEAPEFPYANFPGAKGPYGGNAQWTAFAPSNLDIAHPPAAQTGITVPAAAVNMPIEIVCIGLIVFGTAADTLTYAAYGTNKRA